MDNAKFGNMRRNAPICLIVGAAALLAVMGLVFCRMCPAGSELHAGSPHWRVGRMVVGNLTGLALGGLAVAVVLAQGLTLVGTMIVSFLGCLHMTPMLMCGIPWASFGGSMVALAWLALGVLASAMLDKNELVTARVNGGKIWQAAP